MEKERKFSIIIPVYNNEKYLKKCLRSALNQTYNNFEVIAVDDGSTDNSGKILDKYEKKYTNLIVIHQENKGVSEARKVAVNQSSGDYICFLDSDDWYDINFLESINKVFNYKDTDIIEFGIYRCHPPFYKKIKNDKIDIYIDKNSLVKYLSTSGKISQYITDKVFPTDIIKKAIKENNISLKICEDAFLMYLTLLTGDIKKVSIINKCFYHYRLGNGVTSQKNKVPFYNEIMRFKYAVFTYTSQKIDDESLLRANFVDLAVMSKYYSCVFTEHLKTSEEKEKIISDVIFNNPSVIEAKKFFLERGTTVPECLALINYNAKQYTKYIESYYYKYKKNMTIYQKIRRLFGID
ncbi:MAG: glycosyltransferase [Clostridia bacterium]|nr:glycosyltransferase [Clostridia bacterium]